MNIEGIISISGKPGLFKVIAQTTARIIIEDIDTKKRKPAFSSDKVLALSDITVFGHAEDLNLGEVFEKIFDKEKGKVSISHKDDPEKLRNHFESIWEDYNDEEVKDHDIKKIFQWYNKLVENNLLTKDSSEEE